jgi:hypothetical protein
VRKRANVSRCTLEVITRVDRGKLGTLLGDTGFELVNDRVAVRYRDLFTQTHVYMYCSLALPRQPGRARGHLPRRPSPAEVEVGDQQQELAGGDRPGV